MIVVTAVTGERRHRYCFSVVGSSIIFVSFYGLALFCGSAHTRLTQGHHRFHILGEWVLVRGSSFTFFNLPHFSFLKGKNYFPLSIEFKGKNLLLVEQILSY